MYIFVIISILFFRLVSCNFCVDSWPMNCVRSVGSTRSISSQRWKILMSKKLLVIFIQIHCSEVIKRLFFVLSIIRWFSPFDCFRRVFWWCKFFSRCFERLMIFVDWHYFYLWAPLWIASARSLGIRKNWKSRAFCCTSSRSTCSGLVSASLYPRLVFSRVVFGHENSQFFFADLCRDQAGYLFIDGYVLQFSGDLRLLYACSHCW